MKKLFSFILIISLVLICGCTKKEMGKEKSIYLPEAKNDKIFTHTLEKSTHKGDGYTISLPEKDYRYEKEFDDGAIEESWKLKQNDNVKIMVTTYKNTDEITARVMFLKENDDYIFEDFTGYSICGAEPDGDTLWFNIHQKEETVYIVSWEYPKNTKEHIKEELSQIAGTFEISYLKWKTKRKVR